MKDEMAKLVYQGKEYNLIFNLNVLEEIQDKYGTLGKCLDAAFGHATGEPSIKALSFMVCTMVNEAIDIENEKKQVPDKPITVKQAGRMLSEFIQGYGLESAVKLVDDLMEKSLEGGKNSKNE